MNATLLAALNDAERLLIGETKPAALAGLDEDQVLELHSRVRRARNKYVGQYRRTASTKVAKKGGRGAARGATERASLKAQAFEKALARVSRRLATLAKAAAGQLRAERLATARSGSSGPAVAPAAAPVATDGQAVDSSERAPRTPASRKRRADTQAQGARRQAKRDSR